MNCNTTHYRANSSSVPGDPTLLEPLSERFRATLDDVMESTKPVLVTMRPGVKPWTDKLKKMPDTQVIVLSRSNYAAVKQQVRKWLDNYL